MEISVLCLRTQRFANPVEREAPAVDAASDSKKAVDFDQTLLLRKWDSSIGLCLNTSVEEAVRCSNAGR
jgi:hypothetical protein